MTRLEINPSNLESWRSCSLVGILTPSIESFLKASWRSLIFPRLANYHRKS
ncbi:unnamed protein product [Durusdinium trenchii]|uniref:Uncharacterized protein n=1 Tax=Durusdinium trenchii TaxID=1381693 RepID=A0ABP0IV78_9DINO